MKLLDVRTDPKIRLNWWSKQKKKHNKIVNLLPLHDLIWNRPAPLEGFFYFLYDYFKIKHSTKTGLI
jgi:hypothetical protein